MQEENPNLILFTLMSGTIGQAVWAGVCEDSGSEIAIGPSAGAVSMRTLSVSALTPFSKEGVTFLWSQRIQKKAPKYDACTIQYIKLSFLKHVMENSIDPFPFEVLPFMTTFSLTEPDVLFWGWLWLGVFLANPGHFRDRGAVLCCRNPLLSSDNFT